MLSSSLAGLYDTPTKTPTLAWTGISRRSHLYWGQGQKHKYSIDAKFDQNCSTALAQLLTTYFIIYNHSLFDFLIVCVYYLIAELHVKEKSLFHCLALSIGKNGTTFLTKKDCTEKLPFLCEKGIIDGELNREYTERMDKIANYIDIDNHLHLIRNADTR